MGILRDGKFASVLSVQDPQDWSRKLAISSTKNLKLMGNYLFPTPPPSQIKLSINANDIEFINLNSQM